MKIANNTGPFARALTIVTLIICSVTAAFVPIDALAQSNSSPAKSEVQKSGSDSSFDDDTLIALQRRPGMLGGPNYDLAIYGSGRVEFHGDERNCVQTAESHLDPAIVRNIILRALPLAERPSSDPGAGWYDGPSSRLIVKYKGRESFYGNLVQDFDDLPKILEAMDEVTNSKQWIGPPPRPGFTACGSPKTYPTLGAFLNENALFGYIHSDIKSSNGDINGDGLVDWVGTIESNPAWLTLYVLIKNKDDSYTVDGQSPQFEFLCGEGLSSVEQVKVSGVGHFYVEMKLPKSCGNEMRRYHFSRESSDWRLTALQVTSPGSCNSGTRKDLDLNFLSGRSTTELRKDGVTKTIKSRALYPPSYLRHFTCRHDNSENALLGKLIAE